MKVKVKKEVAGNIMINGNGMEILKWFFREGKNQNFPESYLVGIMSKAIKSDHQNLVNVVYQNIELV
jgi:hypothetical protein